jgi:hypothetical protein
MNVFEGGPGVDHVEDATEGVLAMFRPVEAEEWIESNCYIDVEACR